MLVCVLLCASWHARPRVQRAPGLPCALCFFGANEFANLGRNVSRECEVTSGRRPGLEPGPIRRVFSFLQWSRCLLLQLTPGVMGPGARPGRRKLKARELFRRHEPRCRVLEKLRHHRRRFRPVDQARAAQQRGEIVDFAVRFRAARPRAKTRDDAKRPPHPVPAYVTTADAPLCGTGQR